MDFEQNNDNLNNQQPPMYPPQPPVPQQPTIIMQPKKKSGWRIFLNILLVLSVLANIVLFLAVIGLGAAMVTGQSDFLTEKVIYKGPRTQKIALIRVEGVIDSKMARNVIEQIRHARSDSYVKGIILNVDSPGGTITGSDQIYDEILKCKNQSRLPVVAFMRSLAASGGYYVSVGCDEIIAEPTTITGSIGVVMGYFVIQELLEGKLGIEPVIVKSGQRKDWPSSFRKPSEEEMNYFEQKLITPAYERFVQIVNDGREELNMGEVMKLADGSIYGASEALEEKLVDSIGYFDEAIQIAKRRAGISEARIVEYIRPFSFSGLLSSEAKGIINLDRKTIYELSTPEVMYLWSVH